MSEVSPNTPLSKVRGGRDLSLLLELVRTEGIRRWSDIEEPFIHAVSAFDAALVTGKMTTGEYKKKAGAFNDLIIYLLENATKCELGKTQKRSSVLFDEIDIDICFPAGKGTPPSVGAEVKMLGAPGHKGNKYKPRSARADLHKRIREVAFTSIDFKAANSEAREISSFQSWCKETNPKYFAFWAFRVADDADFTKTRSMTNGLRHYCNGVGAFFYEQDQQRKATAYKVRPASELSLDKAIKQMAQEIVSAARK